MTRKNILSAAVLAATLVGISSCDDKDLYDPNYAIEKAKAEYDANFVAKFGDVSQVTSWDFSSGEAELATRGTLDDITCENLDNGLKFSNNTNQAIINAVSQQLPDTENNTTGTIEDAGILIAPNSDFYIFPISAQGAWTYTLYAKVTDPTDSNVSKTIEIFTKNWTDYSKAYRNGDNLGNNQKVSMKGAHIKATAGSKVEIYIQIKNADGTVTKEGDCFGTTNNSAKYIGCGNLSISNITFPQGVNLNSNATMKFIGFEDSNAPQQVTTTYYEDWDWNHEHPKQKTETIGADYDYNDLVLMIVGNPDIPQKQVITNDEYTNEIARPCKRYMIEDLGNTDDFDFNDLVVDVEAVEYETHHITKTNGVITEDNITKTSKSQVAYIRAMGGTKDFTLKIGDTTWTKSENNFDAGTMYNTTEGSIDTENYLAKIDLPDNSWVPADNNVIVIVGTEGSTDATTITFGEAGHAPLMIATDRSQAWSAERTSADWIKEKMKQ